MNTTLKTLIATVAVAGAFAPSAIAKPMPDTGPTQDARMTAKWQAYQDAVREHYAKPAAPVSDDGGVPMPMAGGAIAIAMLSFGGLAAAVKRRKTVRPAFPTC
jgi:hypothetical protein